MAGKGRAWQGEAWQGKARNGAWHDEARPGLAWRGKEQGTKKQEVIVKQYSITLEGQNPLLLHNDNLSWTERVRAWMDSPKKPGEDRGTPGDDRSPAWRWIGCLYEDRGLVSIPADNLMSVLRDGGKKVPVPGGRKGANLGRLTQSGLVVDQSAWPILVDGEPVSMDAIHELKDCDDFSEHEKVARELGFELFVKRVKIGRAKHVRVRPRFDRWSLEGTITVLNESITQQMLSDVLAFAGQYCGLCDWRPGSPTAPGSFGIFTAKVREVK